MWINPHRKAWGGKARDTEEERWREGDGCLY